MRQLIHFLICIILIFSCLKKENITPPALPVAKFSFEIKSKGIVAFKSESEFADEHLWNFGEGNTSVEKNPTQTFKKNGKYKVSLTVKNLNGSNTYNDTVAIADLNPPMANFTFENKGLGFVEFRSTSQYASQYLWDFGDGKSSLENHPKHTYSGNGDFLAKLTVKNDYGENSKSQIIKLTNASLPKADFTYVIGTDGKVTFSNTSQFASSYLWDFGDGISSNLQSTTHTYKENKSYRVKLIAKNEIGENAIEKSISISNIVFLTKNDLIFVGNYSGKQLIQALDGSSGNVKWSRDGFEGRINGAISLVNGVLYFSTNQHLYAVDATNGNLKWQFAKNGSKTSPIVYNGVVYIGTGDSNIYAINISNGSKKWETNVASSIVATPKIHNSTLYVGTNSTANSGGTFYAIDINNGTIKWQRGSYFGSMNTSARISGNNVYYGGSGGFHVLNSQNGNLVTHSYIKVENSTPIVNDNHIYALVEGKEISKINLFPESVLWSFNLGSLSNYSNPILIDNNIYVSGQNSIWAINSNNGIPIWSFQGSNFTSKNVTHASGVIYATDMVGDNTELIALEFKTGKVIFKKTVNGVLGDMTVLAKDGKVTYPGSTLQQ